MLLLFKKESYNPLVNERMNTLSVSTYTALLNLFFRTYIPFIIVRVYDPDPASRKAHKSHIREDQRKVS